MFGLNLFIAGIEKCGTTSLADWLVANGLAAYRVPGIKEPYSYAFSDASINHGLMPPGVLLDASVGYAFNPQAIARMPQHNTKVILCFRNHFDRCYSAYSFYQAIARRDETSVALLQTIPELLALLKDNEGAAHNPESLFEVTFQIMKRYFPVKSEKVIRQYFEEQAGNICSQSFQERAHYEIGFFLRRRAFPFFSILGSGFFTHPLRNLLVRYQAADLHLLTLDQLGTETARAEFVKELLGSRAHGTPLPPLPSLNTSAGDAKPDFHTSEWDFLRDYFRSDLIDFKASASAAGVSLKYVNQARLDQYLM